MENLKQWAEIKCMYYSCKELTKLNETELLEYVFFISLYSVLTGIEMQNKYQIKNSLGQQIYFAYEGKL